MTRSRQPASARWERFVSQKEISAAMKWISVQQQEIMIGRSSQYCQIILTEQDISRKHCSIKYEYQGSTSAYYVTDYSTFE